MADYKILESSESITVRFVLSSANASEVREELKEDYTNIPKLNKDTFESFGDWVFEEISECIVCGLTSSSRGGTQVDRKNSPEPEDDDSSQVEPW